MRFLDAASPRVSRRGSLVLAVLSISLWVLTGCLVRHREKIPAAIPRAPVWKTASLQELLGKIQSQQEAIHTMDATATIEPSVSYPSKGEIVHYRDVRTFILIREPSHIRMIGLYPVVENKAFDMSSDGETFRLYIPLKNRFIIGKSGKERPAKASFENLRPQVVLDALLWKGPAPGRELAVLESFTEEGTGYYIIHIIRSLPGQPPVLVRNIWFDRLTLLVVRLEMFDDEGEEVTDVLYGGYAPAAGISYPREIIINRPKDLYGLRLAITNLQFNQPLSDDKFALEQPPGTELVDADQSLASADKGN
jgi:hypothetical protein